MTTDTTRLLDDLQQRNLIAQKSGDDEGFTEYFSQPGRVVYCGFDPTADSLHVGHLVPLLMLKRFQLAGHKPLALIGGATGMIGDPSFKATERSLNSAGRVAEWVTKLGRQINGILDADTPDSAARIVNNADWMAGMDVLTFLRDVGKYFSVNSMIGKESVKQRINRPEQGISFTEFSYSLLQSYDFSELNRRYDCVLQIGGNDQWGNITAGIDLTRRMNRQQVFGMTLPLITKSDGTKFGKTESGTVWLDPAKTSPYSFYQFWLNSADADVYEYLKYYTFLSVEEIDRIKAGDEQRNAKPEAQRILAEQLTLLIHGEQGLAQAQRISQAMFSGDPRSLTSEELQQLSLDGAPALALGADTDLQDALTEAGLAGSRKIARELISAGAVLLNGVPAEAADIRLDKAQALHGRYFLIRKGKKHFCLVEVE
ncbi:tyrosine--tRNA ligase [Aliamphritea hakodatensis]|uniref:tyrosine--tRNA ligase n=1 Tax=Aliamphritea hakodatensis TaxID=2895352 RepID=UPI0022FD8B71|nr:tyrosine--tRNA ligase [Aliamphritea hakodatensis]